LPLQPNWAEIINWQTACLAKGHNGIGIPDLLVAQNSRQQNCKIYSLDKHFRLMTEVIEDIQLFD
jgi:predicted nucleic acid-binding protein